MQDNFFQPFEDLAGSILSGAAGLLGYSGVELLKPPTDGKVTLPDDLFAQAGAQTEWWYYTGHCKTQRGREFGFELVFFKRRTDRDKIGIVPMNVLANPMYFAHFAISDVTQQKFHYEHIRSFGMPFDVPVSMSETSCDVKLGDWSLREVSGRHILRAAFSDGIVFDAILDPSKPVVLNGDNGITKKKDGASKHFSYTRMKVAGQLSDNGDIDPFIGTAWMDREFGSWEQGNWDWFSIQFDDGTELMMYEFQDDTGSFNGESTSTYVDAEGKCTYLKSQDFEIEGLSTWVSPHTGAEYPSGWEIRVPGLDIDIKITPLIEDQELDTRGSTIIVYWEGACKVDGTKGSSGGSGRAYVELVGYDMSHMQAGISDFLFGRTIQKVKDIFI